MVRDIYRDMCLASPKESETDRHAKFRLLCGGRLKLFVSGGAALDRETRDFLQKCFRVPEVIDGYGSTYHSFIHISQEHHHIFAQVRRQETLPWVERFEMELT